MTPSTEWKSQRHPFNQYDVLHNIIKHVSGFAQVGCIHFAHLLSCFTQTIENYEETER